MFNLDKSRRTPYAVKNHAYAYITERVDAYCSSNIYVKLEATLFLQNLFNRPSLS